MEVCQTILELQEERAVCYNALEQAFQEFVRNEATLSSAEQYMRVCQQVKNHLESLDERLANLKSSVSYEHSIYEWIEQLEQLEKYKLETTVSVQKIRKDMKLFKDRLDGLELAEQQAILSRQYLTLSQVIEDIDFLLMEFRNEKEVDILDKTE
ncbi:hypothetical protein Gasu2_57630 [Galdieria sulphuraria]|nr:hypothetical protein Gasu2_57630 [Galdieria sulphuraria]